MDELIVDMNQVSCYDMIEQYCADTVKQLNHLQKQRYAVCLMFNATKASEILACYLEIVRSSHHLFPRYHKN